MKSKFANLQFGAVLSTADRRAITGGAYGNTSSGFPFPTPPSGGGAGWGINGGYPR